MRVARRSVTVIIATAVVLAVFGLAVRIYMGREVEDRLAAVITLVVAGLAGRLVLRRLRARPALNHIVGDEA